MTKTGTTKSNKEMVEEIIKILRVLELNPSKNKDLKTILIFSKGKMD